MKSRGRWRPFGGVSIRFEVRGGFRPKDKAPTEETKPSWFQSALRFAVVSDGVVVAVFSERMFQSALRFAVVSDSFFTPILPRGLSFNPL